MSGIDPAFRSFYGNRSVQVDVLHRVCPNLLYGTNPENGQRASRNQNYRFN